MYKDVLAVSSWTNLIVAIRSGFSSRKSLSSWGRQLFQWVTPFPDCYNHRSKISKIRKKKKKMFYFLTTGNIVNFKEENLTWKILGLIHLLLFRSLEVALITPSWLSIEPKLCLSPNIICFSFSSDQNLITLNPNTTQPQWYQTPLHSIWTCNLTHSTKCWYMTTWPNVLVAMFSVCQLWY